MTDAPHDASSTDDLTRAQALERRIAELEAAHEARVVRAELRMEARLAGMVDLDGLKLADAKDVRVGEDGEVQGAAAVMQKLRRDKPWLFGAASTSSTAGAPPAQPPKPRMASDMTYAEWQAARADLVRRR